MRNITPRCWRGSLQQLSALIPVPWLSGREAACKVGCGSATAASLKEPGIGGCDWGRGSRFTPFSLSLSPFPSSLLPFRFSLFPFPFSLSLLIFSFLLFPFDLLVSSFPIPRPPFFLNIKKMDVVFLGSEGWANRSRPSSVCQLISPIARLGFIPDCNSLCRYLPVSK